MFCCGMDVPVEFEELATELSYQAQQAMKDGASTMAAFGEELNLAVSEGATQFAQHAHTAASNAVESSLDQVVSLRGELSKYGYEMKHLQVKMSVVPEVDVEFIIHDGASLANFSEKEEQLTELQSVLLHALEKKAALDGIVARRGMVFQSVSVILSVPPSVAVKLGFQKDALNPDDSEPKEGQILGSSCDSLSVPQQVESMRDEANEPVVYPSSGASPCIHMDVVSARKSGADKAGA
eukprot:TRINITY_DN44902_c0_g1_i1.p1 TRINITY_DN44902_c0_g1~~TRINITY_DN44902_c0_g1_i1.p1  ORF type:complete len:238 (+),score=58.90 TRINITY_DN44902_c0_g1_i1:78-791(+)